MLQTTLKEHLQRGAEDLPNGIALASLLLEIADCSKNIAHLIAEGALSQVTAKLATTNVQGETQMQLDVLSNDLFIASLDQSGVVAGAVSEELDAPYLFKAQKTAPFIVAFDPLDGSSNVAVNGTVGSIFCILPSKNLSHRQDEDHTQYLQAGNAQVAAGYVLYGPATMLVLTIGKGTHAFTLDAKSQNFLLTHENIQIPETPEFAINASNQRFWEPPIKRYVTECCEGLTGVRERDFNMRWVASMVADVHRILMRGGVYLYPKDTKLPARVGRLRLLYEANPMSFIVEQAGGKSSTGRERILELQPNQIHERVPVVIGSHAEVSLIELYHQEFDVHLLEAYSLST